MSLLVAVSRPLETQVTPSFLTSAIGPKADTHTPIDLDQSTVNKTAETGPVLEDWEIVSPVA